MELSSRDEVPQQESSDPLEPDAGSDAAARLHLAALAATRGIGSRTDLQAAAAHLVRELKNVNLPPEQILLRIKRVLAEAGLRPTYASSTDPTIEIGPEAVVYRDVIAWSIKHYYTDGTDGGAPVA